MIILNVFIQIEFNAGRSRTWFIDGISLADKNLEDYKVLILVRQLV